MLNRVAFRDLAWLAVWLCGASAVGAQSDRVLSPPNPEGPTIVYTDIYGVEILEVDARAETFLVEADLVGTWTDPRLAGGPDRVVFQDETALEALKTDVWWPGFELTDAKGSRDRMHIDLTIWTDGSVYYRERFLATIKQTFDLSSFPFDEHDISFNVQPFAYNAQDVVFAVPDNPGGARDWEPSEWIATDPELVIESGWRCSASGSECSTDKECGGEETCDAGRPSASVHMSIQRVSTFYAWKIILPLILIVLVSSAVFWVSIEKYPDPGDRLTIAFTSVLTVVAFDFVSAGSLPKLWYTTTLDQILIASYVFLAGNILENIAVVVAIKRSAKVGEWIDRVSRFAFPPAYLLVVLFLILVS